MFDELFDGIVGEKFGAMLDGMMEYLVECSMDCSMECSMECSWCCCMEASMECFLVTNEVFHGNIRPTWLIGDGSTRTHRSDDRSNGPIDMVRSHSAETDLTRRRDIQ